MLSVKWKHKLLKMESQVGVQIILSCPISHRVSEFIVRQQNVFRLLNKWKKGHKMKKKRCKRNKSNRNAIWQCLSILQCFIMKNQICHLREPLNVINYFRKTNNNNKKKPAMYMIFEMIILTYMYFSCHRIGWLGYKILTIKWLNTCSKS